MSSRSRARLVPNLIAFLLAAPVLAGLLGTILPAFGYLPALGADAPSLQPFRDLLAVPGLWRSVLLSAWTGFLATLLSVAVTMLALASLGGAGAGRLAERLLAPLLAVPHAAAAIGFVLLVSPSGLLFRLAAPFAGWTRPPDLLLIGDPFGLSLVAGLVLKETPFLLLVALAALPRAEPARRIALARSFGHGRVAGFVLGVWPPLYRQIRLPVLAVAAFGASVVDVAIILGPSTPAPLGPRLLEWMNDPDLSMRLMASAGALLQCAVAGAVILAWIGVERLAAWVLARAIEGGRRLTRDGLLRAAGLGLAFVPATATGLALVGFALWSFAGAWGFPALLPSDLSLRTWERALGGAAGPLQTTLLVALLASLAAVFLTVALLEALRHGRPGGSEGPSLLRARLSALLYLPLVVPQIAFAFGLSVGALVLGLRPGLLLLVAVHLVFVLPYVVLVLAEPWGALDPRFERLGRSLGHSRLRVFLGVRLPLLLKPLLAALAIGFSVSVGQYLPTILIGAGLYPTITTEAVALATGGDRRMTGAYALLQSLLPLLAFALPALVPALLWPGRRGMRA